MTSASSAVSKVQRVAIVSDEVISVRIRATFTTVSTEPVTVQGSDG
jgi:hypothetical protein